MALVVEWQSWLKGQRKEPPTEEDSVRYEMRRQQMQQRVEQLKAKQEAEDAAAQQQRNS